jgi:hypothetical protein
MAAEGLTREAIAAQLSIGVANVYRCLGKDPYKWRGALGYRDRPVAFIPRPLPSAPFRLRVEPSQHFGRNRVSGLAARLSEVPHVFTVADRPNLAVA